MPDDEPRDREPLPAHLKKWHWGAFILNWVWGLGNNVYVALLMFVPGVNLVMPFVLGAKGTEWAWQKGNWANEAEFVRTQLIWSRVGLSVVIGVPAFFAVIFALLVLGLRHSDPYKLSIGLVRGNARAITVLGEPIEQDGWIVSGNISYENDEGSADLDYEVAGPLGQGAIRFVGHLDGGEWVIDEHTLILVPHGEVIDLTSQSKAQERKAPVIALTEAFFPRKGRSKMLLHLSVLRDEALNG
jgi:hypothetical protein